MYGKSARDPWLLATSLKQGQQLAKRVVKVYRFRMQIEEGFRDMKSHRFGQGFEYNKTRSTKRLSILVLLTSIAHWLLMAIGFAIKELNRHRQYQASSVKTKNVLSLHFIGLRVIADRYAKLKITQFLKAMEKLHLSSGAYLFEAL